MFSSSQEKAINHFKGPMMVLAGAGSGKTTIITNRIHNLVDKYCVDERKILVVTFTVAAATEMKNRYEIIAKKNSMVNFGTFHRIFFGMIRNKYNLKAENIIKPDVKYNYLKNLLLKYNVPIDDEKELINDLSANIAKVKEQIDINLKDSIYEKYFKNMYIEYHKELRESKLIDFEDMELLVYKLMQEDINFINYWKEKFEFLLVDEFQDINPIQYKILKMLIGDEKNIFIVGDDDQSIYGFRGSNPEIMLGFNKDFPDTKTINLDINYRSTKNIVDSAKKLISNNKNRFYKNVRSNRNDGEDVEIIKFESDNQELNTMAKKIIEYKKQGISYNDICVLLRTNTRLSYLTFVFGKYNIPFKAKDYVPNIYDNFAIKDILSYLKLSIGEGNISDLVRIANRPVRYISTVNIKKSDGNLDKLKESYRGNISIRGNIITLKEDLSNISKLPTSMAIKYILNVINYKSVLEDICKENGSDIEEINERIDTLIEISAKIEEHCKLFEEIANHTNNLKKSEICKEDSVNVMTIHSSKGLEFKKVFVIDVNENIIPHKKNKDIEEERRLMYVAMTRAIDKLHIYFSEKIRGKDVEMSRFIREIKSDDK